MFVEEHGDPVAVVPLHRALAPALAHDACAHREWDLRGRTLAGPEIVVTIPAGAGVVLPEVGQEERSTAAGVFRVAAHHYQPRPLNLVLAFRLRLRGLHRFRDGHRPGPADVAVRLPGRRAEIGQPGPRRWLQPGAGPGPLPGRGPGRGLRHGRAGDASRDQVARHLEIVVAVPQPHLRWPGVPAGAPDLLVIRIQ